MVETLKTMSYSADFYTLVRQYSVITKLLLRRQQLVFSLMASSRTLVIASAVPKSNSAVYNVSCILCIY